MNKGFSLVELIVVIAIMAILVGVAVPVYTSYIGKAQDSVDIQTLDNLEHACKIVNIEYGCAIVFEEVSGSNGSSDKVVAKILTTQTKAIKRLTEILSGDVVKDTEGDYTTFTVEVNTLPSEVSDDDINALDTISARS